MTDDLIRLPDSMFTIIQQCTAFFFKEPQAQVDT